MRKMTSLLPVALLFLSLVGLVLTFSPAALAQSEQDGLGRVEYDEGTSVPPSTESAPSESAPVRSQPVRSAPAARGKNGQPVVGRKAAEKYMAPKKQAETKDESRGDENHYMTVALGSFVNDHAWKWGGNNRIDDSARFNIALAYRFAEWTHVADINGAIEYTTWSLRGSSVQKISLLPKISFPDVSSHFPLYFGLGAGLGIFTKQLHDESALSFDYQVFAGLRFLNVFPQTGFFVETGLKNQVLLLSDGQFNGWFISLGAIFAF